MVKGAKALILDNVNHSCIIWKSNIKVCLFSSLYTQGLLYMAQKFGCHYSLSGLDYWTELFSFLNKFLYLFLERSLYNQQVAGYYG